MELRRRIGYPRSYFHVINRGARKVGIFADDADRKTFRGLLGAFAQKHSVTILSWCLMPNHYHLQSDCEGTPLSLMMRDLDRTYARLFNQRHRTSGCLFQGPFKSMVIPDLGALCYVNRYVHLNPVDLGRSPEGYAWSSCSMYLGTTSIPPWMDIEPVMSHLRRSELSDAESYAYYLNEGFRNRKKRRKKSDPVGAFFAEWVRYLEEKCIERLFGQEHILGRVPMETLVSWLACHVYDVPAHVVAEYYGLASPETVRQKCRRMRQRMEEDAEFRDALLSDHILTTLKRDRFRRSG